MDSVMASWLVLRALGSSCDQGHCFVFLGKTLFNTLTLPLSTQVYKWVQGNLMLGVTLW